MKLVYLKGKQANYGFMPFGKVIFPETVKERDKRTLRFIEDKTLRFYKREVTLKAALRRIEKQHYEKETIVHLINWYVGYADILVYI